MGNRNNRTLGPLVIVQMSSCEEGKQCDIYNHGSIHAIRKCEKGFNWVEGRIDVIPNAFSFVVLDEKPETKKCHGCNNDFPIDWTFYKNTDGKELCGRCIERYKK